LEVIKENYIQPVAQLANRVKHGPV
jgi:hypothetical protein